MAHRFGLIIEATLLAMACLSPWAFGAVTAWAEFGLYLGVVLVATLGAARVLAADDFAPWTGAPSLALGGLVLLASLQAAGWPGRVARRVAPSTTAFADSLLPAVPEGVRGDTGPPPTPRGPALSSDPERTRDAAIRLAAGWVLFQAALGMGGGRGASRRFGLALAGNACLLSLFAIVQSLTWNGRIYWTIPATAGGSGGPFVNKNHLAAYLILGLGYPLCSLLVPGRAGPGSRGEGRGMAAACAAGLIAAGVVASLSRGGFVAILAATAVLLVLARPRALRIAGGLGVMLGLAAAFLVVMGPSLPLQQLATLSGSGAYDDRLGVWEVALRAWGSRPTLGLGLGAFAPATARFFESDIGVFYEHAENEYVEVLVEGGAVGLALALVVLLSIIGLGLRGSAAAPGPGGRVATLGGLFAMVALAVKILSDYPLHIPAIAVTAVILAAHLARAGLDARGPGGQGPARTRARRAAAALAALLPVAVSLLAAWHGLEMARADAALAAGGLPPAGLGVPTTTLWGAPMPALERARGGLEGALRHRPDWAEGHARLGLVRLSQYRAAAAELVADPAGDPKRAEAMADPLWLHGVVHSASPEQLASAGGVLDQEPVRLYLVPAARSFLEARRCCPAWGLPHAELASLDYLLRAGESTSDHARRALLVAGPDVPTLAMAARAAAQAGDPRLAALCWRKMLRAREQGWGEVADQAGAALTPRQILDWVLPDGRYALRFADRLYAGPEGRAARDLLLGWAVDRLPGDLGLPEADRLHLEAQARSRLGQAGPARERMLAALALEPGRAGWRKELVEWLVARGEVAEAHDQALVGLHLGPDDPDARRAVELAAEALSRGPRPPPAPGPR